MKKLMTIAGVAIALTACGPEGSSSYDLTFKITEANAKNVIANSVTLTEDTDEYTPSKMLESYSAPTTAIQSRASQSVTLDCSPSGTMTLSATVPDSYANTGDLPTSGQMSVSTTFNNCDDGWEVTDGGMSVSMSWSGYNESNDTYNSLTVGIDFDDFKVTADGETSKIDGGLDISTGSTSQSVSWDLYSQFNGQTLRTSTPQAISIGLNDTYPSAGVIRVEGADDTFAEAKIVPNGYEVTVNGGQATLYTWDQF
ncbi:hypothetical protein [Reinekea blandensis]|uniref:Lipoprotein n=1 Tax=Reinekea blandensis MED297 TaxID=314283 RepID=A4BKK6_9GAMM|nr:hypothetical protein [Reinekea blandensis]EAR07359.1 hypothetical protein MED297_07716 [Reinekea sp. MED297] [Reinekea blandensis MED297]